jgi:hypothetical protein
VVAEGAGEAEAAEPNRSRGDERVFFPFAVAADDGCNLQMHKRPVRLAYQPPASSTFLSEQTSHQQSASSTLLSQQISTSHQPPANRTG